MLEGVFNSLGNVANIIGSVIVILGAITATTKGGKKVISKWIRSLNSATNKAILCVLRSNIHEMCDKCLKKGYMTSEDFENLAEAAEAYGGLDGNSYTHKLLDKTFSLKVRDGVCGEDNCTRCKK